MPTEQVEPSVFIGSSSEGKLIAEKLQEALDEYCESVVWDQGIFFPSSNTLESLVAASQEFDFAILVLTPDDLVLKKGDIKNASRGNVIFELGLFIGSLGQTRTFIVHQRDDIIDIPTDLTRITRLTFKRRNDKNIRAAINHIAVKIRDVLKTKGKRVESATGTEKIITLVDEKLFSSGFPRYIYDLIEALPKKRIWIRTIDKNSI
jgi:predicted nucleotide-binding protein